MLAKVSRMVMLVRGAEGISSAVNFYQNAIGLPVLRMTAEWAELSAGNNVTLHLQSVSEESKLSVGYSPWITFEVTDMAQRIAACCQAGAHLDGPIQYPAHGSVALLRTPDNHLIGLYQPKL